MQLRGALIVMLSAAAASGAPSRRAEPHVVASDADGWYWIYDSIAHAQSFEATGTELLAVHLRVAHLSGKVPAAPLVVEIRDPALREVLARGAIAPRDGNRELTWRAVDFGRGVKLHAGTRYALVAYSTGSDPEAPWVVNAIYSDVYPGGHHYGYADDLYFALDFRDGADLRVGPEPKAHRLPLNAGIRGGAAMPGPPAIYAPGPIGAGAEHDPFGVLPGFEPAQLAR